MWRSLLHLLDAAPFLFLLTEEAAVSTLGSCFDVKTNPTSYAMTLAEVIPLIDSLPRSDKFELMRFILSKLSKDECLPSEAKPAAAAKKKDALWDIVGMADGEDADVARNHDKHLYGAE